MSVLPNVRLFEDSAFLIEGQGAKAYAATLSNGVWLEDRENCGLFEWSVENATRLRQLGCDVPTPFLADYSIRSVYSPFLHQLDTADFLVGTRKGFVFSSPGVGKTASAIWAADYLMEQGEIEAVLVVCPLSIMRASWLGDLFTCAPHRHAVVAHGSKARRIAAVTSNANFVITNYDSFERFKPHLLKRFGLIIIDEANAYKGVTTNRFRHMYKYVQERPELRLWLMTGTPASQSPEDAYGLAKLVCPDRVPKFFGRWRDMVMTKVSQYRYIPKSDANDRVFEVLQPAIRYRKEDCLDLPPMTYQTREIPLSSQQRVYYERIRKEMLAETSHGTISAVNAGVKLNKLLQISAGSVYTDDGTTLTFDVKQRTQELLDIISNADGKVIVFCGYRHTIEVVSNVLAKEGITHDRVDGTVSEGNRSRIFSEFQSTANPRVLVMQPQAVAHGLTLTAANTIVWWGPTPSLETYDQANARIDRQSQRLPTNIIHFVSSPAEAKTYTSLRTRKSVQSSLLAMYDEVLNEGVDTFFDE